MALKAIKASGRGNVLYYYGQSKLGTYCLLRGAATKDSNIKATIKQRGYVWQESVGTGRYTKRVMAYRKDGIVLHELISLLAHLQHLGCEVKPSEKLPPAKHLLIGEWNPETQRIAPATPPKIAYAMFTLNDGSPTSLADLKQFLIENKYEEVAEPVKQGQYAIKGDWGISIYSFGFPARLVSFVLDYDTVDSLKQWRTDHWASIGNCRIYGSGFAK